MCVPWLFDGTKTVTHSCPSCGKFLARHKCRFGDEDEEDE